MRHRLLLPFVSALFLSACSGADLLNALVPGEGYRVVRDVAYGDGPRRRLDLYIPDATAGRTPTVVFFYGGGWEDGSKDDYLFVGEAFVSRGYAAVIPDYRVYPEVRFPAFLEDAAAAVAWVGRQAGGGGFEPGPIFLVGHSAGGHIAAMLTLDEQWLADAGGIRASAVAATVGLAGPYDFLPLTDETLMEIFGPEPSRPASQPINHVDGDEAPMLLVSGLTDTTVLPRNSRRLGERIRAKGGSVEEAYYEDVGHVALAASLARPLRFLAPVLDVVDDFLRRHAHPAVR